jgi:hypothetical protein
MWLLMRFCYHVPFVPSAKKKLNKSKNKIKNSRVLASAVCQLGLTGAALAALRREGRGWG